ncbi:MAG: TetR/AcrR family transcriptional regulator [Beijerinckiaceae bacterium]
MSWNGTDKTERRGYHHGNLREALIAAALDLIKAKGPAGFTFAEAARAAGVSPAAPYRHYRDRDMLMADVALKGFQEFARRMAAAWNGGAPNALTALNRLGQTYLAFAREEPAYYAAMFESGISPEANPDCATASNEAFNQLRLACEAVTAHMPDARRPPTLMMALHIWSMSHGIASLFARGDAARRPLLMQPEELLEAGVLIYLDGLGVRAK